MKKFLGYAILILTILNTVLITAVLIKKDDPSKLFNQQKYMSDYSVQIAEETIELSTISIEHEEYSSKAKGYIKNLSDKELANIEVLCLCYDQSGKYIDTVSTYVAYLPPNEIFDFYMYIEDETYNIKPIKTSAFYYEDIS